MKKIFKIIFAIIIFILILICGFAIYKNRSNISFIQNFISKNSNTNISENTETEQSNIKKSTVSYNGFLHTNGSKLENQKNEPIQLKGLSSHGIEWYSDIITYENLKTLRDDWNINVFRIAMYTDVDTHYNSEHQGYIYNMQQNKDTVYKIVDMAIDLDMYVIVDWHILDDNNPQTYKQEAQEFFYEVSKKYGNIPNIIYEICNEPNGNDVTWDKDIKPYAEEIIPIIRANSKDCLIIVGTPDWCKKVNKAADNPLNFSNIVYSCHFYSGTHGNELREKINYCLDKNIPIFVSECGLTDASGNGNVYFDEFNTWIEYLNSKNISWVYWSFSNKNESSAILTPDYTAYLSSDNSQNAGNEQGNNLSNSNNANNLNNSSNLTNSNNNQNNNSNTNNSNTTPATNENTKMTPSNINENLTEAGKFIKKIFKNT